MKNIRFYWRDFKVVDVLVLCNKRLTFSLECLGILLVAFKLLGRGVDQQEYNTHIANALLYNIHATSLLYQAERQVVPISVPDGVNADKILKQKKIIKEPEKLFPELHKYVRKSSIAISKYFGLIYPSCQFLKRNINLIDFSPDSEVVALEIARYAGSKYGCKNLKIQNGLEHNLIYQKMRSFFLEIFGALFIFLSLLLRYKVLIYEEGYKSNKRFNWALNKKNIKK